MVPLEYFLVRRSVGDFNRRFPEGTPQRELAVAMLREMESPNKAEEKLHAALMGVLPGERIVRKRRLPPFGQVEAALSPFRRRAVSRDSTGHIAPGPPPAGPQNSEGIVPRDRPPPANGPGPSGEIRP
jgi:hypothetical protein